MLLTLVWGFKPTHGLTSTDENFSLATATALILTSHGEVRFLPGKWVNVGMAHHIGKTKLTSCWWLAEDCHVHIQRKACGTVLGQRWAETHYGKGHIVVIERTSKACPSVSSVGGWPQAHAWRLAFPAPHVHSLSVSSCPAPPQPVPAQGATDQRISRAGHAHRVSDRTFLPSPSSEITLGRRRWP